MLVIAWLGQCHTMGVWGTTTSLVRRSLSQGWGHAYGSRSLARAEGTAAATRITIHTAAATASSSFHTDTLRITGLLLQLLLYTTLLLFLIAATAAHWT